MTLSPEAIERRRRAQALVFGAGALVLLTAPWLRTPGPGLSAVLFAVATCAVAHLTPARRASSRFIRWLGAKPLLSAVLIGALALASSLTVGLYVGVPVPAVHDEFSYLLAADTFAHGRLTNPTHPMWIHFEAPHILHHPTYMSKYPPAQGLVLALGQVTFGHPIVGVWLSAALACGALTWMLAGWMPGRWALAGGMLSLVHPVTVSWSQRYWGGLVPVLGGALFLGALGRLVRHRPRARDAVVLGVGVGILVNSRPYEGLALVAPLGVALAAWVLSRRGPQAATAFRKLALPLAGMLLLIGSGMLYYNYRVTGHPLVLPYAVHQRAYATQPLLIFQTPLPAPVYRHDRLERFFDAQPRRPPVRTLAGLGESVRQRAEAYVEEYFHSMLVVAVILLLCPLERSRWQLLLTLTLLLFTAALGLQSWRQAHYAAPAAGLALLVVQRTARRIACWRLGRMRVGRPLVRAAFVVAVGILALGWWHAATGAPRTEWAHVRARIEADLARAGGKHLIMVRYTPTYPTLTEWVFNVADIDAAPVVWAAEMAAPANARLLAYFKDRRVWLVEPNLPGVHAVPYSAAGAP